MVSLYLARPERDESETNRSLFNFFKSDAPGSHRPEEEEGKGEGDKMRKKLGGGRGRREGGKIILAGGRRTRARRDTYFAFTKVSTEPKHKARFLNADHPLHYRLCGRMLF